MKQDKKSKTCNFTVELEFDTTDHRSVLDGIRWSIVFGGENEHVLENPDVEVLFSAYPFPMGTPSNLLPNSNDTEIVILTGSVSGEADGPDWYTIADKRVRESGLTHVTVRLDSRDVVDFCDSVVMEMAKSGECRVAEFQLRGKTIAEFVSSGDSLWEYFFDTAAYADWIGKREAVCGKKELFLVISI